MTAEVTSCKMCADQFGLRYVPPADYYSYICDTLPKRARRSVWRRLIDWFRA